MRNGFGTICAGLLIAAAPGGRGQEAPQPQETRAAAVGRFSAVLCYSASERQKFRAVIDEQKRGARIGGVIDKEKTYQAQRELLAMDALDATIKHSLKSAKIKPTDCRKFDRAQLESFFECIDGQRDDSIDDSADESAAEVLSDSVTCASGRNF